MWPRALLTVVLRGPGKALLLASAVGWVVMAALLTGDRLSLSAAPPGHGGHLVAGSTSILDHAASFTGVWLAMIVAMSPPLLLRETGRLWRTSLRRLRHLTMGWFAFGYISVWCLAGAVLSSIFGWLTGSAWRIGVVVTLLAVWQCSPWRHRCLNACHRPATLRLFGTAAQRDALRYGISTGSYCAASCGSFMFLVLLATDYHLVLMAIAIVVSVFERYSPARRPRWRLPLLGGDPIDWPRYGFVEARVPDALTQ
jgi:predicted metal-binding membrane protein